MGRKIDETMDRSRAAPTWVVTDDVSIGWLHTDYDDVLTPCDTSRDYTPVPRANEYGCIGYNNCYPNELEVESVSVPPGPIGTEGGSPPSADVFGCPEPAPDSALTSTFVSATSNEVTAIRPFLDDAGVLSSTDGAMSVVEMRDYVCGRVARCMKLPETPRFEVSFSNVPAGCSWCVG